MDELAKIVKDSKVDDKEDIKKELKYKDYLDKIEGNLVK